MREGLREQEDLKERYLEYLPTFMRKEKKMTEAKTPNINTPNIKGLLVIYVNVGQLPPYKAEAFVERLKDSIDLSATKRVCEVIYIPTRDRPTGVEYIPFGA